MKSILIVGAGTVGKVYAYRFSKAGHSVAFLAKEKYRETLEAGVTLYDITADRSRSRGVVFDDYEVFGSWSAAADRSWDEIYLCISSDALTVVDFDGLNAALFGPAS